MKGPGSMISQVLRYGGNNLVMQFRGFMDEVRGDSDLLGTTHLFPTHSKLKQMGFHCLLIGYPITGEKDSLLSVFRDTTKHFAINEKPTLSLTMPLVGTNVGGISIEEWVSIFRIFINELSQSDNNNIHNINIAILRKKLSSSHYELLKSLEET